MRHARTPLLFAALALIACDHDAPGHGAPSATAPAPPAADPSEAAGIRFIERLTGGARATEPLPLIIALHGLGDRPEHLIALYASITVPARLIAPYGLAPFEEGFSWFAAGSLGDREKLADGTRQAAGRLAAMITEIARRHPASGKAIVTGFSQGGMLSYTLAALHPEAVRAAFPISGLLAEPLWPSAWPAGREMPRILGLHGAADARVPIEGARGTVKRLREIGLSADLVEYAGVGHTITAEMRRDVLRAIEETASAR